MEYSLTRIMETRKEIYQFDTLEAMFEWIKKHGELDGWIIRVHHL